MGYLACSVAAVASGTLAGLATIRRDTSGRRRPASSRPCPVMLEHMLLRCTRNKTAAVNTSGPESRQNLTGPLDRSDTHLTEVADLRE